MKDVEEEEKRENGGLKLEAINSDHMSSVAWRARPNRP